MIAILSTAFCHGGRFFRFHGTIGAVISLYFLFSTVAFGEVHNPEAELFYAACFHSSGQKVLVRELAAQGADVNQLLYNNEPAIVWACRFRSVDRLVELLECGADIASVDAAGKTLLEMALFCDHQELTQILVKHGAKDLAEGLLYAGAYNRTWAVEMLAPSVACPNATNVFGQTPIMLAAYSGHDETLSALLKIGANPHARDRYGCTALMYAVDGGHVKSVQQLLSAGSDVNAVNKNMESALMRAARCGHPDIVRILSAAGADLCAKDIYGNTPLMKGIYSRNVVVVHVLLELGCDINERGVAGMTPLIYASVIAKSDMIDLLIKNGADIHAKTKYGDTALTLAETFGHNIHKIDILRKASEDPDRRMK